MKFNRTEIILFISAVLLLIGGYTQLYNNHTSSMSIGVVLVLLALSLPILILSKGYIVVSWQEYIKRLFCSDSRWRTAGFLGVVVISISVYGLTVSPSASLWDCAEFISAAYKLQVPHPPGAPLFLLIGHLFSLFSLDDPMKVALMINWVSVISSGLAAGIIYLIGFELLKKGRPDWLTIMASMTGALIMAFMDTFWFSAVEAEIYAMASLYSVFQVYLAMKWKSKDDHMTIRKLLLMSYLLGLGYCIHPMCLLTIPVVVVIYLPLVSKYGWKGWILSFGLGCAILMFFNRVLSEGVFKLLFKLDVLLVNTFSLPFFSSVVVLILMSVVMGVALHKFHSVSYSGFMCSMFYLMGLAPYVLLFVRSASDTVMDQHNPENLQTISAYISRESYGTRPFVYGPYYDARIVDVKKAGKKYLKTEDGYEENGFDVAYVYEKDRQTFMPRMNSSDENHVALYKQWAGISGNEKPKFRHNLTYLFKFQLGHMYFRYLLWNFIGRAGDHMHAGLLKPWESSPVNDQSFHNSKAYNQLWLVPFLLGLFGLIVQARKDPKNFGVVFSLFVMTGPILAFYLNSPPSEPRERDYIYVVSFMVYCLWIAIGFRTIGLWLMHKLAHQKLAKAVLVAAAVGIVALVVTENYDDHNRSSQTLHLENARAVLNSCEPNAILFTGGDNDTFPLWYLQDVEGFRTDVRVLVLSYFNSGWCIEQSKTWHHDSPPLPITLGDYQMRSHGPNDVLFLNGKTVIDVKKLVSLINDDHPALRLPHSTGGYYHKLPGQSFKLSGDKGELPEEYRPYLIPDVVIKAKSDKIYKSDLAFLDIAAHNEWQRPIYFNFTSLNGLNLDLDSHIIDEGLLYRFIPAKGEDLQNLKRTYQNLVINDPFPEVLTNDHYMSTENHLSRILEPIKMAYNSLATGYLEKGQKEKANKVIDYAIDRFYPDHFNPGVSGLQMSELLIKLGRKKDAGALLDQISETSVPLSTTSNASTARYYNYVSQMAKQLGSVVNSTPVSP